MKHGYHNILIGHDSNGLNTMQYDDIENVSKNRGLKSDRPVAKQDISFNDRLKTRKKYSIDCSGCSDFSVTSLLSRSIMKTMSMRITVRRNISYTNIPRVGDPVLFQPTTLPYLSYAGNYILEVSDYVISRSDIDNWDALCYLTMFRTT